MMINTSVIKNYPSISARFNKEWFENEFTKDQEEMHPLAKQFTFEDKDGNFLDSHSLQYLGYIEKLLKDMEYEINSQEDHFKRLLGTNKKNNYIENKKDYTSALAEIEIGSFFKKMEFKIEFEPPILGINGSKSDIKINSDGVEVFIEVSIKERPRIEGNDIFSWDDIPGNDNAFLVHYLKQIYYIDLEETKIEKIDSGKTIKVSFGVKSILLKLNNEETKVNLKIDDGRTDEFIVKNENDKLKVYANTSKYRKIKFTQPFIYKDKILGKIKNKQLSESNPNIIALYLEPSSIPEINNIFIGLGFDRVWKTKGDIFPIKEGEIIDNSLVSAVLVYIRYFDNRYKILTELCLNPKADNQLPDSLIKKFRDSGTEIIKPEPYNEFLNNPTPSEC
ncbi:MAG: hypothetical protein PHU34_00080 [Candidatus Methanoperedens sp.]|nr:hypothetical protein [Candidatus Methanoperedens sp.]